MRVRWQLCPGDSCVQATAACLPVQPASDLARQDVCVAPAAWDGSGGAGGACKFAPFPPGTLLIMFGEPPWPGSFNVLGSPRDDQEWPQLRNWSGSAVLVPPRSSAGRATAQNVFEINVDGCPAATGGRIGTLTVVCGSPVGVAMTLADAPPPAAAGFGAVSPTATAGICDGRLRVYYRTDLCDERQFAEPVRGSRAAGGLHHPFHWVGGPNYLLPARCRLALSWSGVTADNRVTVDVDPNLPAFSHIPIPALAYTPSGRSVFYFFSMAWTGLDLTGCHRDVHR